MQAHTRRQSTPWYAPSKEDDAEKWQEEYIKRPQVKLLPNHATPLPFIVNPVLIISVKVTLHSCDMTSLKFRTSA